VDFSDLKLVLKAAVGDVPAVTVNWGKFIQTCLDFVIVAFAVFMLVKAINTLKRKQEAAPPAAPPADVALLTEIRDLLKTR
jgi:large conductance mechanosensitive channel